MLILTHGIKNLPNYYFSGNDLYVLEHFGNKKTIPTKKLSQQVMNKGNRETKGYYIERKFRSLSNLNNRKFPVCKVIVENTDYKYFGVFDPVVT